MPKGGVGEDGPRKLKDESELSIDGGGAGRGGGNDVEAANRLSVSAFATKPSRSAARELTKLLALRVRCVVRS